MAKQEKWVGRFVGVPGNSSASCSCSIGDSQVPANAHKLTVSRYPWQIGRCWYFLQSSEYSIFPPWSILNSLRFRPSSVVGITVHWSLLFNYSPNINWASPMLSTALVSRYIVVNFFFFFFFRYYGNTIEHSLVHFQSVWLKLWSPMPNGKRRCLKFPLS